MLCGEAVRFTYAVWLCLGLDFVKQVEVCSDILLFGVHLESFDRLQKCENNLRVLLVMKLTLLSYRSLGLYLQTNYISVIRL